MDFERDLNAWTRFDHQVRAAVRGAGQAECFTITIPAPEDEQDQENIVLDVLGRGNVLGDNDASSQHALQVFEFTTEEKARMSAAIENLTQARKNRRNLVYYLLSIATSHHARHFRRRADGA